MMDEACCYPDGMCEDLPSDVCINNGGMPMGPGTDCATTQCLPPEACCYPDGSCLDQPPDSCLDNGGSPQGPGTDCATTQCPPSCWDCPTQCHADSNCDGRLDVVDIQAIMEAWQTCYGDPGYNPCADADRDGTISMNDLSELALWWPNNPDPPYPEVPPDCLPDYVWPPTNLPPWCGPQ